MGNPRQKRKLRSSISKVTKKPKSKKKIVNHPIIAANWDKSQTLDQNYRRLGLTRRLNKSTGGVEKKTEDVGMSEDGEWRTRGDDELVINGTRRRAVEAEVKEARVERDAKTGKILKVVDQEEKRDNPLNDPLNSLDSDSDDSMEEGFDQHGHEPSSNGIPGTEAKTALVERLEREASKPVAKYKRKQSEGEKELVEALVRKYGDDYAGMARDMRINYMQRSEGDLKRRVRSWREAGGTVQ